jgi:hypothetical protein
VVKRFLLRLRARLSRAPVVILFDSGRARRVKGNVSGKLLAEFTEVAGAKGVTDGLITVVDGPHGPALRFVGRFDTSARQRFRNVWFARPQRKLTRV